MAYHDLSSIFTEISDRSKTKLAKITGTFSKRALSKRWLHRSAFSRQSYWYDITCSKYFEIHPNIRGIQESQIM